MKKRLISALLALVLVVCLMPAAAAISNDDGEPNNTLADAVEISVGNGHSGQAVRDIDVMHFTLDKTRDVRLTVSSDNPECRSALLDSTGAILGTPEYLGTASNPSTFLKYKFFLRMELPAGDYYVVVRGNDNYEGEGLAYGVGFVYHYFDLECRDEYHSARYCNVDVPATCVSDGQQTWKCGGCGATGTEVIPMDETAHTWQMQTKDETLCDRYNDMHFVCTGCGAEKDEEVYLDHVWGDAFGIVDPTAETAGTYQHTCTVCGVTEQDYLPPLYHRFIDVAADAFYHIPVAWADYKGITSGIDPYRFGPNGSCLRAQVVTFLWRAAGCPEPKTTENPFKDVKPSDFFHKAVLWAVEEGITNGISETEFGSYAVCNRAAVVTFLWRYAGSPAPELTEHPFTDIPDGAFYETAVLWAIENNITNGISSTTFGPTTACNRAQVVTFLHRAYTD